MFCSLKVHDPFMCDVLIFLLVLVCGSFQFILLSSLFLPSFFMFFHFLHLSILLIISSVIHGFHATSWLVQPNLIVSNMHFLILFHCTSTFPLSQSIAPCFSSSVRCIFCHWANNIFRSHLSLAFWNFSDFLQSSAVLHDINVDSKYR